MMRRDQAGRTRWARFGSLPRSGQDRQLLW